MCIRDSTDTILPHACAYARPILIAAPLMMSSLVMNNILRYEGKASFCLLYTSTAASWFASRR